MSRRSPGLTILILVLTGLCSCGGALTVEQQIIATIREMEEQIEGGERNAFMEHFAEDFSGQEGALTRDQVRALVIIQLNRYKQLQAQLLPIHVSQTAEDTADAQFSALVTGGPDWIPETGQVFEFDTNWRRVGGKWLLHAASWDPEPFRDMY